ncbi:MAG: hypothetical protein ACREKS_16610 [Candidatus Rokuibacteriota bacterium]
MKTLAWMLGLVTVLACGAGPAAAQDSGKKFNDAAFIGYEGAQKWPTGAGAQIVSDFAVPIYFGLPNRPYKVLGRVYDDRTGGIGVMARAFAEGLFSERDRQRDCADQAKFRGGDALVVTNDERVIKAFGLSKDDLAKTTPLFQNKDSVTLVIKFE